MRSLLWITTLVTLLACPLTFGTPTATGPADEKEKAQKPVPLPRAAAEARRIYNAAVKKAHDEYLKQLDAAMRAQTKAGDLDGALLLRDEISRLKEQGPPTDRAAAAPPAAQKDQAEPPPAAGKFAWDDVVRRSARVEMVGLGLIPLVAGDQKPGWFRVPHVFATRPAAGYAKETGKEGGYADFRVVRDGILLLACNFGYEGNNSGDWQQKRWTKEQFVQNGWAPVSQQELGGPLVNNRGDEFTFLIKEVKKGENYRLRCNKYHPPVVIEFTK